MIDTESLSERYRRAAVDLRNKRLLITNFSGTEQEQDLREPPNCGGFGRIRHFHRATPDYWPSNPLPIDPACKALRLSSLDMIRAQAFQNAVCNWRCWYCFVPFGLLKADARHSAWFDAPRLIDLYLAQPNPPLVIDLTGGQPDLVPEWIPWMMSELSARGLQKSVYLWSDDNLSNDYFWRYLSDEDREVIATYPSYGRVCCFKGFNEDSFAFNTQAASELFSRQFELIRRFVALGIDLYTYLILTTPSERQIAEDMARFVDRLQAVHPNLPLRTVPLEVQIFTPVKRRLNPVTESALRRQRQAVELWSRELESRFTASERSQIITEVSIAQSRS